ncbi:MAG: hypothetical protein FWF49_06630 [Oscillospiraceae bacterium]|nr:hypothetical protein [Oscillospiraceae bacterium]
MKHTARTVFLSIVAGLGIFVLSFGLLLLVLNANTYYSQGRVVNEYKKYAAQIVVIQTFFQAQDDSQADYSYGLSRSYLKNGDIYIPNPLGEDQPFVSVGDGEVDAAIRTLLNHSLFDSMQIYSHRIMFMTDKASMDYGNGIYYYLKAAQGNNDSVPTDEEGLISVYKKIADNTYYFADDVNHPMKRP